MGLPKVILPTPCSVAWDSMTGDQRVRRCPSCEKNVYNVSRLKRRELEQLIARAEGSLPCLRAYRRPDGTVVTSACVISVMRATGWIRLRAAVFASLLVALWSHVARPYTSPSGSGPTPHEAGKAPSASKKRPPKAPPPKPPSSPSPVNGGILIE
jgi:hypothetical protein